MISLGRHRNRLDRIVRSLVRAEEIGKVDWNFDPSKTWLDGELKGLEFLPLDNPTRKNWSGFWPQRGNQPN